MTSMTQPFRSGIALPNERIAQLCEKYQVEQLAVYGSVLRDDFGQDSDVDFLVDFKGDDAGPWMSKIFDFEKDLTAILGRKVKVVTRRGVEQSANWIKRSSILDSTQVVYRAVDGASSSPGTATGDLAERAPGIPPLILGRIRFDSQRTAEFCRRHDITRLSLFGSVLRDDFSPESDVDVLVEFQPGRTPGLRFFTIQEDLAQLFGRRVDLNTPSFLSRYFRDQVQAEALTLYESQTGIDRQGSIAAHA